MIIYKITNTINGKVYIGITKQPLVVRFKQHKLACSQQNKYDYPIYRAMRKHGIDHFIPEILEEASTLEEACAKEKYYITEYQSHLAKFGYNATFGGISYQATSETKMRISHGLTGKKKSKQHRKKLQNHLKKLNNKHHNTKKYEITFPDGHKEIVCPIKDFCRKHNLTPQTLCAVARGIQKQHKGFIARKL